jgi:hypothetical protein
MKLPLNPKLENKPYPKKMKIQMSLVKKQRKKLPNDKAPKKSQSLSLNNNKSKRSSLYPNKKRTNHPLNKVNQPKLKKLRRNQNNLRQSKKKQ